MPSFPQKRLYSSHFLVLTHRIELTSLNYLIVSYLNILQWEIDQVVPKSVWKEAGENGMLCVTVPEEYGGLGLDV